MVSRIGRVGSPRFLSVTFVRIGRIDKRENERINNNV